MLTRLAKTFRQQADLAIALSWVGGYVNVVVLIHTGMSVSNVTGNTTQLGELIVEHRWAAAWLTAFLPLSFLIGATLAGACEQLAIRLRRRRVFLVPMAIEAALLAVLSAVIVWQNAHALDATPSSWRSTAFYSVTGVGSIAMGIQNATITRISGAAVRTTHLTGVITDLGLELATIGAYAIDRLRGRREPPPSARRLVLFAAIASSFLVGVVAGAFVYGTFPNVALVPPALFLIALVRAERNEQVDDVSVAT